MSTAVPVRVYLSLGSNLGDRFDNLAAAVRALAVERGIAIRALSPVYETEPIGPDGGELPGHDPYLNCAVALDVALPADALRTRTAGIERRMGRVSRSRYEPRRIDIDVLLYGSERIASAALTVPHPRLADRLFVVRPLLDLDPMLSVEGIGPLAALLDGLAAQGCVEFASAAEFARQVDQTSTSPTAT